MEGQIPDWYNSMPDAQPAAVPKAMAAVPGTGAAPAANGAPDWYNSLQDAPANPQITQNSAAGGAPPPPERSLAGHALHATEVAGVGLGKGAVAASPIGLAVNAPSMGAQLGAAIGTIPAYGVNLAMDNPTPWTSAKATARETQDWVAQHIPNTSSLIDATADKFAPGVMPKPENKAEDYINSAAQFAGGGRVLGQNMALAGGAGLASEAAGQATAGSPFEPVARTAAGIAPFAGAAALSQGPKVSTSNPLQPSETITASPGRAKAAFSNVTDQATNPDQVANNIARAKGSNEYELVPGVKPTLGEVANDQGIAQAQNTMRQKYPQPFQGMEQQRQAGMLQSLGQNEQLGSPDDVSSFVGSKIGAADKAAADEISAIGQYGKQPDKGATGLTVPDAQKFRQEQAGDMWQGFNKIQNEPADLVTLRNKAQDLVNQGAQYGVGGLHPDVKAITDQILNPPNATMHAESDPSSMLPANDKTETHDTVRTLQNFMSQMSAAKGNPNLPRTAGSQISQLQEAARTGLDNTVKGLALDQPAGKPAVLTKSDVDNYFAARQKTAQNYTLEGLEQRQAITPEGRINPKKFDTWTGNPNNAKRLQAQELQQPLNSAANAQRSVENLRAAPIAKTAEPNADPVKVIGQIFSSKTADAAKSMHDAMNYVQDSPEAVAGLKSAVAKHINDNIAKVNGQNVGRQNDLVNFFNKNRKALSEVYTPEELANVQRVAAEIQRNQQFERMANIKGQSNTAKNAQQLAANNKPSLYNLALKGMGHMAAGAAMLGEHFGGLKGMAAGFGASKLAGFVGQLREAGIKNREMLELKMYTDPEFFQAMNQRFNGNNPTAYNRAIAALKKTAPVAGSEAVTAQGQETK